jgi:hypothetical protein
VKLTVSRKNKTAVMISYTMESNGRITEGQASFKKDSHYKTEFHPIYCYDEIVKFIRSFKDSDKLTDTLECEERREVSQVSVRLRRANVSEEHAQVLTGSSYPECFAQALAASVDYPTLILWDDKASLCAVDVDYHNGESVFSENMDLLIKLVTPSPHFSWITKSGGLRLIYTSDDVTSAYEHAVLAALCVKHHDSRASVEFKCDTWHPASVIDGKKCGPVTTLPQVYDDSILSSYLGSYSTDQNKIEEYLTSKGLEVGKRYPHSQCPINATDKDKRNPVSVTDNGIYCYVCNSEDRYYPGVKKVPGFVPYGILLKGSYVSLVNDCVLNLVHFYHAKYVLKNSLGVDFQDEQLEVLYRILLKKKHGTDKLEFIEGCFNSNLNFVRVERDWRTEQNETCNFGDASASLRSLPITWYLDDEGKKKPDSVIVEKLTKPHDLSTMGYLDLQPYIGISLYNVFNTDPNPLKIPFVYNINELSSPIYSDRRPTYVPKHERRITPDEAYSLVESIFPGINLNIVKLLIAVRGLSEVTDGHGNFIFIRGSTGSGKTAVVQIASAILGDNAIDVAWMQDTDDLRRRIAESKTKASYIIFNEVIKAGKKANEKQPNSLKFLLNITPRETYHKLYYGPCQIGRLPCIILTDTDIPPTLMVDRQIGRRVIYVETFGSKAWDVSLRNHGMKTFYDLRLVDESYAHACNVILSDIVDSFFCGTSTTYKDIVKSLGFAFLHETEVAKQGEKALQRFYYQWCREKPVSVDYHPKWFETKGDGWRIIDLTKPENELTEQWLDLADGIDGYDRYRSERVTEAPWPVILGENTKPIKCIIERKSSTELALLFCEESEGRKVTPYVTT